MSDTLKILKQSELFGTLPERVITQEIIPNGQILTLSKKQQIIRPRQCTDSFYVVLSGKIRIEYSLPDGGNSLQAVLTAGNVLGAELISGHRRTGSYYAVAATSATVALFPIEMLTHPGMLDESCRMEIRNQLMILLSRENMRKDYFLAMLSLKGLRERIVMYLRYLAEEYRSDSFDIPLSRDEMAAILCVNRSCLSHELSLMEQDGMISFRKGQFLLHDPENWKSATEIN